MSSLDLTRFLPPRYRDKTIDTLLKSAFNRHLTQESSVPLFGYVGDSNSLASNDIKISERDLERELNQLTPLIHVKHGSEEKIFSWPDLIQKMLLLGIDYNSIGEWFSSGSYNFVPPIDLDKFSNYSQYYWVGNWITTQTALPYSEIGLPNLTKYVYPAFESNPDYIPEYYVIARGSLVGDRPRYVLPDTPFIWSDWSYVNLWVHKDDALAFIQAHPGTVDFLSLVQATRPIIEYSHGLKINSFVDDNGVPSDDGIYKTQVKYRPNQPPMFDLYESDGTSTGRHAGVTSSIFYYVESPESDIDPELQRRLLKSGNDFVFGHSLVKEDGSLYFYKENVGQFSINAHVSETTPMSAPVDGAVLRNKSVSETLSAQQHALAQLDTISSLSESSTATDSTDAFASWAITESMAATEAETAGITFNASTTESQATQAETFGGQAYGTAPYAGESAGGAQSTSNATKT